MRTISVVEIARLCGVSASTVCRALNNKADINPKQRKKIISVCQKHGYSRNSAASNLRLKNSNIIACLVPGHINEEVYAEKAFSLKTAISNAGYICRIYSPQTEQIAEQYFHEIASSRPAGVIIWGHPATQMKRIIKNNKIPVVFYDPDFPVPGMDCVTIDRATGCFQAVCHLIQKGRKRILLMGTGAGSERGKGYLKALRKYNVKVDRRLIMEAHHVRDLYEYGYQQTARVFQEIKFDAIFAVNDACAIGAMSFLHKQGVKIPERVAVVGFDGIPVSSYVFPALTTLIQPVEEMARHTIDFLLNRIKHFHVKRQFVKLKTELCVRASA